MDRTTFMVIALAAAALACGRKAVPDERDVLEVLCGPPGGAARPDHALAPSALACFELGVAANAAQPPDPALARSYFRRACDLELGEGCHNLAVMAARGDGGGASPAEATAAYVRACLLGYAESCVHAGDAVGQADPDRARALYEAGCAAGRAATCVRLGNHLDEGTPRDVDGANAAWTRACDLGSDAGCYNVAVSRKEGRGITADREGAVRDFRALCERGFARGCSQAGETLWRTGADTEAVALFERGCALSEPVSCLRLGDAYAAGRAVPVDAARAREHHARACTLGYAPACR